MKTPLKTPMKIRALAFVASFFVTSTIVHLITSYHFPAAPGAVLAQASRQA